eukprot:s560_g7.t1
MRGWQTVQQRSCAEEIVWMNRERTQEVRWMLEEDADQPNIIKGKRKRNKVDYRAVEREIEAEERRHKDVFSDGSNESHGEWSAMHASQCAKATKLFHQWMLLTCTPRHEEILKRKGKLITRLSVSLVGPGQLMLKKGLQSYGIALHFHAQETTVVVDAAARQRYQERHAAEWQAARVKLASRAQAAAALREGQAPLKPPLAEPMAAQDDRMALLFFIIRVNGRRLAATCFIDGWPRPLGESPVRAAEATTAEPPAKRKRLRRIVDSDDEAPTPSTSKEADEAAAGEPTESIRPPQNGTVTAAPEMPSEVAPTEAVMAMPTEAVENRVLGVCPEPWKNIGSSHVEYQIGVKAEDGGEWVVSRRYREFQSLQASLRTVAAPPPLPERRFHGAGALVMGPPTEAFLAARQVALQEFLEAALARQHTELGLGEEPGLTIFVGLAVHITLRHEYRPEEILGALREFLGFPAARAEKASSTLDWLRRPLQRPRSTGLGADVPLSPVEAPFLAPGLARAAGLLAARRLQAASSSTARALADSWDEPGLDKPGMI